MNVYFELGPDDDYRGKPKTWRRVDDIPSPSSTILFAESASSADHIMPHYWIKPEDARDVASKRHRDRATYGFVDGHSESMRFHQTYAPPEVDLWNPLQ